MLDRLLAGLDQLGLPRAEARKVVARAALDSIPRIRLEMIKLTIEDTASDVGGIVEDAAHLSRGPLVGLAAEVPGVVELPRNAILRDAAL